MDKPLARQFAQVAPRQERFTERDIRPLDERRMAQIFAQDGARLFRQIRIGEREGGQLIIQELLIDLAGKLNRVHCRTAHLLIPLCAKSSLRKTVKARISSW